MQKPISIKIDTTNDEAVINYNNVRKGDTLLVTFKIFQGSASLDLTGQSMHVVLQKPDGYAVEKIISSVTGNNFTVAFDVQATLSVGNVEGIVEISDSSGTNITNTFSYEVKENPSSTIITQSKNEIETLSQIIDLIDSYNDNADNLATQNTLALQNIATLENDIDTGDILHSNLQSDISSGNVLHQTLQSDITTGNALDTTLKSDFVTGETLHNKMLTAISNGNDVIAGIPTLNMSIIQSYISLMDIMLSGMTITDENNEDITDENGIEITM